MKKRTITAFLFFVLFQLAVLAPLFAQQDEDDGSDQVDLGGTETDMDNDGQYGQADLEELIDRLEQANQAAQAGPDAQAGQADGQEAANDAVLTGASALNPESEYYSATLINNEFYLRSVRLTEDAKAAYEDGDYDASARYAEQAAEFARLSDEFVTMRLAENVIMKAHSRYTWAGQTGAADFFPDDYAAATETYNQMMDARKAESWDEARAAGEQVLVLLAAVEPGKFLPARYTVRYWQRTGDSFWNIAKWIWVYEDPKLWRILYEANKSKLPNPDNPNLIKPGMVLDIPSLEGEVRRGMWNPAANYDKAERQAPSTETP